jgi:hypothetical protein
MTLNAVQAGPGTRPPLSFMLSRHTSLDRLMQTC